MTYLLPAPRIAGYLPARCPRVVKHVAPHSLTASQEEILLAGLAHVEAVAGGCYQHTKYGPEWFAVSELTRPECEGLELYGYLKRHPNRKLSMWYALTALGQDRADVLRADREQAPRPTLPIGAGLQESLEFRRRENLNRLIRELAFQGFVVLAEGGRGPHLGEQAVINMFSREMRLYRCPLGSDRWEERDGGYYQTDAAFARQQSQLVAIPF